MKALVLGIVILLAALIVVLPVGLGWWNDVVIFLRGGVPVLAALVGLVAVFIGIADIRDRAAAKKEEAEEQKAE
jgi:hypothetical protein